MLGLDTERAAEALSTFEGARRRFTQVGEVRGVTLVDDYGLARSCGRTVFTYGEGDGMDVCLNPAATRHAFGSDFTVTLPDGSKREVSIKNNPGRHNMLNATAALTAAYVLGLDTERAAEALSTFEGARRRFTQVGEVRGVTLVDDYGHHPTEVRATLAAAKSLDFQHVDVVFQPHRYSRLQALCDDFVDAFADADTVILVDVFPAGEMPIPGVTSDVVFQPHRYSRLQALCDDFVDAFADADTVILVDVFPAGEMPIPGVTSKMLADKIRAAHPGKSVDDFVDAFADADTVILVDVFPAGEMPIPGVTSKMLADKIRAAHPGKSVYYVSDHAALMARIDDVAQAGDLLITMGAGDITTVGPEYLEHVANEAE